MINILLLNVFKGYSERIDFFFYVVICKRCINLMEYFLESFFSVFDWINKEV